MGPSFKLQPAHMQARRFKFTGLETFTSYTIKLDVYNGYNTYEAEQFTEFRTLASGKPGDVEPILVAAGQRDINVELHHCQRPWVAGA